MTTKKKITISATEFKAHCLELVDRVYRTGVQITITKRGKPVARMIQAETEKRSLYGALPVTIVGDIVEPIQSHGRPSADRPRYACGHLVCRAYEITARRNDRDRRCA